MISSFTRAAKVSTHREPFNRLLNGLYGCVRHKSSGWTNRIPGIDTVSAGVDKAREFVVDGIDAGIGLGIEGLDIVSDVPVHVGLTKTLKALEDANRQLGNRPELWDFEGTVTARFELGVLNVTLNQEIDLPSEKVSKN